MHNFSKAKIIGAVVLLMATPVTLSAQEATGVEVEAWRAVDEAFRQAMIDELRARRGQAAKIDTADELIRTAEDIREALRVSCDLSGACVNENGRATLGERLVSLPAYDEQQGLRNSQLILESKSGQGK